MAAALARAESAKKEAARKGTKEAAKVEARRASVLGGFEADAKAKAAVLAERVEKAAARAEEAKALKVDKAVRMASPGKRANAPPGSSLAWYETPAPVAFECEGFTAKAAAAAAACDSPPRCEGSPEGEEEGAKFASPVRARLEQWEPKRAKLQAEIDAKVAEALARADAARKKAARKAGKMGSTKLDELRSEEAISINLTKELNELRHAKALARAVAANKAKAQRGFELSNTPKAEAQKIKEKKEALAKKEQQGAKMAAALARAESAKKEAARKGTKEAAKVEARRASVLGGFEADAKAKAAVLAERVEKAAARAEEAKALKVDKAVRMASPGKRANAPPGSSLAWYETPAPVAFECEGFTAKAAAAAAACDSPPRCEGSPEGEEEGAKFASPVRARLEQWEPKRAKLQAEIDAKVAEALARADAARKKAARKASKMGGVPKADAAKLKEAAEVEARRQAIADRLEKAAARACEARALKADKAALLAAKAENLLRATSPNKSKPPLPELPAPPAEAVLPPPAPVAEAEQPRPEGAPESEAEELVTSILASEGCSASNSPAGADEGKAKVLKVTTLRQDSPTGSRVISVVTAVPAAVEYGKEIPK